MLEKVDRDFFIVPIRIFLFWEYFIIFFTCVM
nr:MAG TPA: hypothetical protein [Caudoviricetes sp.]